MQYLSKIIMQGLLKNPFDIFDFSYLDKSLGCADEILKSQYLNYIFFSLFFIFGILNGFAQERKYLSGKGPGDAVLWDFKCNVGKNSGMWSTIAVPSNWEFEGFGYYTYGRDRPDYETKPETGYYKRTFQLASVKDKYFRLVFQASMTDTKVKINGKSAGAIHQGGYTQFSYDISDLVKVGKNQIEVEVSKPSADANIQRAERFADFWLFGGIYRPVYIDILPVSHIDRIALDAKMDGQINIDAYLKNAEPEETLSAQVMDFDGNQLGDVFEAKVNTLDSILAIKGKVNNIKPWSHEFPNLYNVEINLKKDGQILHKLTQRFGFRTFEVRDHDGFYLNGKRILLKGASMHSIIPETGRALSAADNLRDVQLIKDLNFNTVRAPCYPPDEHFLNLCDSLGLLVLDELPGWSRALTTENGTPLVKELVARDVNHPSVIMWGNGNHRAHNAGLEDVFLKWDLQKRRPYKNASKNQKWPGKNPGRFELINTQYYPTYEELTDRLAGNQIVMPNETLHALYDGGGGSSLAEYWKAIEESKVGGGLIIWALYDEGVIRADEGYRMDNQGNKAPDGIMGPHREKKGSYNTVKEIWSPVQITTASISNDFDGKIKVENKYDFTDLDQCFFRWKYIRFADPDQASKGYRTIKKGKFHGPQVDPGESGILDIPALVKIENADALEIIAQDPDGRQLWTWRLMKTSKSDMLNRFLKQGKGQQVQRDSVDDLLFRSGNATFRFDEKSGGPTLIQTDSTLIPITKTLHIVAQAADSSYYKPENKIRGSVSIEKSEDGFVVDYQGLNGFDILSYTIMPHGVLKVDYSYKLPKGDYYYAGVGFEIPEGKVMSKRWMGQGPYRVYKNRLQGTEMNVWQIKKEKNDPGIIYNFPEFEGYFGNWAWAQLNLDTHRTIGMATADEKLYLGLLKPNAGDDPKFAKIYYPEESGIYFFNYIAPIGSKWKSPQDLGPKGQLNSINEKCSGTVYFRFDWSADAAVVKRFGVEIE